MPKATPDPTPTAAPPHTPTRRTLMGAVAAPAAAPSLLGFCAEYMALETVLQPLRAIILGPDEAASDRAYEHCDATIWPRTDELEDLIAGTSARTLEEILAKTSVARVVFRKGVMQETGKSFAEQSNPYEDMMLSLLNDILGDEVAGEPPVARREQALPEALAVVTLREIAGRVA